MNYSELDSRRFGKRIFRALIETREAAEEVLASARGERADMLIVRCPVQALAAAQALERGGSLLMDTLVYFTGKTDGFLEAPARVRALRADDLPALEAIARQAFTDFGGHYHADPRLDGAAATEGYVERFRLSAQDPAFQVFVSELDGEPAGFLTLRHAEPADIELNAVAPRAQGRGLYDALVKAAGHAARLRGEKTITSSTPLQNLAPQKVWARNGMEPARAYYTFHTWFDA